MNTTARNPKEHNAFLYCLTVLGFGVFTLSLLLGVTVLIMAKTQYDTNLAKAAAFLFLLLLLNAQFICPLLISRKLVIPLQKLDAAAAHLAAGEFDCDLDYGGGITELTRTFQNMRSMSEELSSMETLRSDFVSNVSHEFKTPLSAIQGYATLLQQPDLDSDTRREYTDQIIQSTDRMASLVTDVLMLSRLEHQDISPELTTFRLDDQILQILLSQERNWSQKDLDFDLNLDEITCTAAESLLYHVWANLISNAIKFSSPGETVHLSLHRELDHYTFSITNTGTGISEKDLRHVFDKFFQADIAHKHEGNGLGLAQVRQILAILHGSVSAQSDGVRTTTFRVTLPADGSAQHPEHS